MKKLIVSSLLFILLINMAMAQQDKPYPELPDFIVGVTWIEEVNTGFTWWGFIYNNSKEPAFLYTNSIGVRNSSGKEIAGNINQPMPSLPINPGEMIYISRNFYGTYDDSYTCYFQHKGNYYFSKLNTKSTSAGYFNSLDTNLRGFLRDKFRENPVFQWWQCHDPLKAQNKENTVPPGY